MLKRGFRLLLLTIFAAAAAAGPAAALSAGAGRAAAEAVVVPASCNDCADCDSAMESCPAACAAICKLPVPAPASAFALRLLPSQALSSGVAVALRGRTLLPDPPPPRAI